MLYNNDKTRYSSSCFLVISTIIGLAIFASEYDNEYFALKWSYAFGWGGALCMFAALVFNIIGASREKRDRVSYWDILLVNLVIIHLVRKQNFPEN